MFTGRVSRESKAIGGARLPSVFTVSFELTFKLGFVCVCVWVMNIARLWLKVKVMRSKSKVNVNAVGLTTIIHSI